jgi:hypothetical protein
VDGMGPVETAVRGDVAGLGFLTGMRPSLAECAYVLAATLDHGAGARLADVARELRDTLKVLGEAEDDDGLADALASLSAAVGNTPEPVKADAGPAGSADSGDAGDPAAPVAKARGGRRPRD